MSESFAISEYLDDVFPGPEYLMVYPRSIPERARARHQWQRPSVQRWIKQERTKP